MSIFQLTLMKPNCTLKYNYLASVFIPCLTNFLFICVLNTLYMYDKVIL